MIGTGIDARVQVQQIIENQLPEFLISENPKAGEFLKQYYISQEHRGGPTDLVDNLDQYIKLDNLTPEVIVGITTLSVGIGTTAAVGDINVTSTKGFPNKDGLFKINNEIFTYTGLTTNTFTGVTRGFSGITSYRQDNNPNELVFTTTTPTTHAVDSTVINLSAHFLKEFYNKIKFTFTPGLEDTDFVPNLDVSNYIKQSTSLYRSKGTEESFKILFSALYGVDPKIIDLEEYLVKPSSAEFIRRELIVAERISGNPNNLVGQTIKSSLDTATQGSVSEVEVFSRSFGRTGISTYYKINLFVGYGNEAIEGNFTVPGKTKVIGGVSVGSSVITVDSTIGFGATGTVICGVNTAVTYTGKTVNQFLGCTGITSAIKSTDKLRSDEIVFGYEHGDLTKKVELRITGVIDSFVPISNINASSVGEKISVRNLGESIPNPSLANNPSKKEVFANSWIYNTSSTYEIDSVSGSSYVLKSDTDKSSLKQGDNVEIIYRADYTASATAVVKEIALNNPKEVKLDNLTFVGIRTEGFIEKYEHDLRRILNKATSSGTALKYGNDVLTSDTQNVYNDFDKDFYVASNSLPSYDIMEKISSSSIPEAIGTESNDLAGNPGTVLQGYDTDLNNYSIISFPSKVPFITGDEVVYLPEENGIVGLVTGARYNVRVLDDPKQIKLYRSLAFVVTDEPIRFSEPVGLGSTAIHAFTLDSHANRLIGPEKVLKKFPIEANIKTGQGSETIPGSTGMMVNGVEILNYKSDDKIFCGPISKLNVLNGGYNYDVLGIPSITLTGPSTTLTAGAGTTALIQPVVSGSVSSIDIDPQHFDIKSVKTVTVTGGNGDGAVLKPFLNKRYRNLDFFGRATFLPGDGGVDVQNDQIIFKNQHNLYNGQPLVYDANGNNPIGASTYQGSNAYTGGTAGISSVLVEGSVYYPSVVGPSSVRLYETLEDYKSGINTVGLTTFNCSGLHKFRLYEPEMTLASVKVINPGSGYQNRKLYVKPVGISTINSTITFENHGFKNGDKILYSTSGTVITGLTTTTGVTKTSQYYQVIKLDDDTFRLTNAGIAGTSTSDYTRKKYVYLNGVGTGLHCFAYPPVEVNIDVEYVGVSTSASGIITNPVGLVTLTPRVRGEIVQTYVYEGGTGYGSTILNFEKKPLVSIKVGEKGKLRPIIGNGQITAVEIQNRGKDYYAAPDLEVVGVGTAIGAKLRAVVENGVITKVIILKPGVGYAQSTTSIEVTAPGYGCILEPDVRGLQINNYERFGNEILSPSELDSDQLKYSVVGYSTNIQVAFGDTGAQHSPIIGWAYDGNPIYGPYGYDDPTDVNSASSLVTVGYAASASMIADRPVGFNTGFFVKDYFWDGSGDLDENNGRFGKTPEFPNGTYAYFAGLAVNPNNNQLETKFPYFIGHTYRSNPIDENFSINQNNFDFNNSNLIRNTFPHKVADRGADNDFLVESNELVDQAAIIESVTRGSVDSFDIVNPGIGYTVGQVAIFDNTDTRGGGIDVSVNRVIGKAIVDVNTTVQTEQDVVFVWDNENQISGYISTSHTFKTNDHIAVSGVSTYVNNLTDTHQIGVQTGVTVLYKDIPANSNSGIVTDIHVSLIPKVVSIGSSIGIGTEKLLVLQTFPDRNVLRVKRGVVGAAHTASSRVDLIPQYFTLPVKSDYFESKVNKKVWFNPAQSVGVGTQVGVGTEVSMTIEGFTKNVNVPSQSIYLPNHPFETNQAVTFSKPGPGLALTVTDNDGGPFFNIPYLGNSQTLYVVNKSKDHIGLTTQVGLGTTGSLFFVYNASDDNNYALESQYTQVTAKAQKITAQVAVSTAHNLADKDSVRLTIKPGQSGVNTVRYNAERNKLLINPVGFNTTGINTTTNTITLSNHKFKTGEKVFYTGNVPAAGLTTNTSYFVYRIDDDSIHLGETLYDVVNHPPNVVNITDFGGSTQELSLINPRIEVLKNNNLVFDLNHSSLSGYELKLFYDNDFKNEFISTGSTSNFILTGQGTTTTTYNYHKDNPSMIYYSVEKAGYISTADIDVKNRSEIVYIDSTYTGNYDVFGVGTTTFNISVPKVPENLSYTAANIGVGTIKYTTDSKLTDGGIDTLKINFGGFGYQSLPKFTGMGSTTGQDAQIVPKSRIINVIDDVSILDPGFEYPSDKTLRPEASISPTITVRDSDKIDNIEVLYGGKNYISAPDLIIIDPETKEEITTGAIEPIMQGSSIESVDIITNSVGLKPSEHLIFATNNTNGFTIDTVVGPSTDTITGILTCILRTPILGFSTNPAPLAIGDLIYVEGIQKHSTLGDGFNSSDLGYRFLTVAGYTQANAQGNTEIQIDYTNFTTATGIAKTSQQGYASVIKYTDYPRFKTTQSQAQFKVGEKVVVLVNGAYIDEELTVAESDGDNLKIYGKYKLFVNDTLRGTISGTVATINTIVYNNGRFDINYSLKNNKGWSDSIGILNEDFQVLPDNDYYQNLSYSIQSPITYDEFINPVNRLVHTSGLKNFADTGITSTTQAGISTATTSAEIVRDLINEERVDTVNILDFVLDTDTVNNKSKYIKFGNLKLADYIKNKSNRVLTIDDFSDEFSNSESNLSGYSQQVVYEDYSKFLVQVKNPNNNDTQVTELVLYREGDNTFTFEKGSVFNGSQEHATIKGVDNLLRITPDNIFADDLDVKILKSAVTSSLAGISTRTIGFAQLTSSNRVVGVGTTVQITANTLDKIESYFAAVEIQDNVTKEKNFVELFVTHDGTNSYISQYYADSGITSSISGNFIGTFTSDISSNILSFSHSNDSSNEVNVRSRIVGFGTTAVGVGTHYFNNAGQTAGTERSARYESKYFNITNSNANNSYGNSVGIDTSIFTSVKSIVRVSCGTTSALHQTLMMFDGVDTYLSHYPFVSIGTTTGIGTFITSRSGGKTFLKFKPDAAFNGSNIEVQQFDELIYTESDRFNTSPDLIYGNASDSVSLVSYNAINGTRSTKTEFDILHDGVPIFEKTFDPSDTAILNPATGEFSISDHFFMTGEKLIYTPGSTFTGIGSTAMQHVSGTDLPTEVYAIRVDRESFKIATTAANANAGTAVTFLSTGSGNSHKFEMDKKMEKSLLSIDGVIQSPLMWSPINTTITNNGAHISTSRTIFEVAGIGTIIPTDIVKIDDEYMKVVSVGIGTTALGPIDGGGTAKLLEVTRGFVGSAATAHANGAALRIYKGSYNMVGSKIHFTEAPLGTNLTQLNEFNLEYARATFNGRVFLRNNYTTNEIFDDISNEFTGIGQTFEITKEGVGIGSTALTTGDAMNLINGIFQVPTTENNVGNNYNFVGIGTTQTDIIFTGITSTDGSVIKSDVDVNSNQLPRGGMIVSLGSTGGLGVAPLHGAVVHPVIGAGKSIAEIVGIPTIGNAMGITTASYNNRTGYLEITTDVPHNFRPSNEVVTLVGLEFTCSGTYNVSDATYNAATGDLTLTIGDHELQVGEKVGIGTSSLVFQCSQDNYGSEHSYPRHGVDPIAGIGTPITDITSTNITIKVGVGTDSLHKYVSGGVVNYGSQYVGVTTTIFPNAVNDRPFSIVETLTDKTFVANVGTSTVRHNYVGSGTAYPYYSDLNWGSGYYGNVAIGVTDDAYEHKFVSAGVGSITANAGGPFTAIDAQYESHTGNLTLTIPNHGLTVSNTVGFATGFLVMSCSRDNFKTNHSYPRTTDPANAATLAISSVSTDTITVGVGSAGGGGYGAVVTASIPYNTHFFEGADANAVNVTGGSQLTPTDATYEPATGVLTITFGSNHGLTNSNTVTLDNNSFKFSCNQDNRKSIHTYPRTTDPASGSTLAITVPATNKISVNVGQSPNGTGGALQFAIGAGGTGYINPHINIPQPSYQNLEITGVSRRGIGNTTDTGTGQLITVAVSPTDNSTGIGSTSWIVSDFDVVRSGHSFLVGDVFKPVGLVTSRYLNSSSLISDFELTVTETFTDRFTCWNFGQFDYIDSIKDLQNGTRTRFPLMYNSQLVSFEIDGTDPDSALVDMNSLLLIIIDGVIQNPGEAYNFAGGTTFTFTEAPTVNDHVSIFFYRGTAGDDSKIFTVKETVKQGDLLRIKKVGIHTEQEHRVLSGITTSDTIETEIYSGLGVDENNFKPMSWNRQKYDRVINGEIVYKSRDSIEPYVYPTARIIGDVNTTQSEIFVDNAHFFNYEENESAIVITDQVSAMIIPDSSDPVAAAITAVVSAGGTISSLSITNGGVGYGTATVSIGAPSHIGVGIGSTATATLTLTNGVITDTTIVNPGLGYTQSNPPSVIASFPSWNREKIESIDIIQGVTGIVTGITTSAPTSGKLALEFWLKKPGNSSYSGIAVGQPLYIYDTTVGTGLTSIAKSKNNNDTVGIGTSFADNIYQIQQWSVSGNTGLATCYIHTNTNHAGLTSTAPTNKILGRFSWGRLAGIARTTVNPVSIGVTGLTVGLTTGSGISTFPPIQRRDYGWNNSGALKPDLG